jgi:hypothetical protein
MMFEEHERVVLTIDLPEYHLIAGDVGTVVHLYRDGDACEVEFFTMDGKTLNVVTLQMDQVRALTSRDVMHVRELENPI